MNMLHMLLDWIRGIPAEWAEDEPETGLGLLPWIAVALIAAAVLVAWGVPS